MTINDDVEIIVSRTYNGVTGVLVGFAPESHLIDHPLYKYKRCCLDHENWEPTGEIKQLGGAWHGYTHYAPGAKCTVCGCSINAGFYSRGNAGRTMRQLDTTPPPSWESAPTWATHRAMDADGVWWWYEKRPQKYGQAFYADGLTARAVLGAFYADWDLTLEERPTAHVAVLQQNIDTP